MPLFRLIYSSRNLISGSNSQILDEIDELVLKAGRRNQENRVTGALLFNRYRFAQVIEGPRNGVETTFERIKADELHDEIVVLQAEPITRRAFNGWGVAFVGAETSLATIRRTVALQQHLDENDEEGNGILSFLMVLARRDQDADMEAVLV